MKRYGDAIRESFYCVLIGGATVLAGSNLDSAKDAVVIIPAALFGFYLAFAAMAWIKAI